MDAKTYYYGIAYIISIIGSQFVIKHILKNMWKQVYIRIKKNQKFNEIEEIRPFLRTPQVLGLLESILYTTACLIEKYEFISVWLLLKVAGSFKREFKSAEHFERQKFNIFLIGNGLLILFSFVGALISKWLMKETLDCLSIIFVGSGLAIFSFTMFIWSKCLLKDEINYSNLEEKNV